MSNTCFLIAKQVLTGNTTTFTFGSGGTLPQTYTDLLLLVSSRSTRTADAFGDCMVRFNGDAGNNYNILYFAADGSSPGTGNGTSTGIYFHLQNAAPSTSNVFSSSALYISNYREATNKTVSIQNVTENNGTRALMRCIGAVWNNTSAITSLTVVDANGESMVAGSSFHLYGITKA